MLFRSTSNLFYTPGVYYRPANLKTLTVLAGATESRVIFDNIHLQNLNVNALDDSHEAYSKYLQNRFFIPPRENRYFVHTMFNTLPTEPSATENKGSFNIFPVDLTSTSALPCEEPWGFDSR